MRTNVDIAIMKKLQELPMDYWDFKEEDTKEYTHGIHNYPAMMISPISRNIIALMRNFIDINALLDPFAGSGTVLVEGMLAGINVVSGSDINPLALFLTKAKTTKLDIHELESVIKSLKTNISERYEEYGEIICKSNAYIREKLGLDVTAKDGWGTDAPQYLKEYCALNKLPIDVPEFKNIGYWFKPSVILELSLIKSQILRIEQENIKNYVFVAFSESIRLVSNRRNGEFKMFRMTPDKVLLHNPNVYAEFAKLVDRNFDKMADFVNCLDGKNNSHVNVYHNNACTLESLPDGMYDLIITSPPYGDSRTTVAYGEYSRLSLQWMNLFGMSDKEIMSVDKTLMGGKKYRNGFAYELDSETLRNSLEKIKNTDLERAGDVYSFYEDLDKAIGSAARKTKVGGYHYWVVGNRTVKGELLKTDVIISELAVKYHLELVYIIDRNIPNKVMPSLNSPTNKSGVKSTTMTMEHIVVLRKC